MAHDLRKLATDPNLRPAAERFGAQDFVTMRPPAHPIHGVIVDGEPLVVGGARYWLVAWSFGGEQRVSWSPESALAAF